MSEEASALGPSPSGWRAARLGDLADFVNGRAFKPSDWTDTGVPIIRIQNLNGSRAFNYFQGEVEPRFAVHSGDLLFSWSGTRGTSFGPHYWRRPMGVLNQHIFNVRNLRAVEKDFLFHALKAITGIIEQRAHGGTGIVHITKGQLEDFKVPLPPLPEQRKIAAILSSLDETIEKTEAVIDQLEVVKNALLEDVLSRGVPGRHSAFRTTELGNLPSDWLCTSLGDALERIDAGWSPLCDSEPARPGEWGVLKVSSVTWGEFRPEENKRLPTGVMPRPETEVRQGDLLVSRANTRELVGRAVVVRAVPPHLMASDKLLRLRPRTDRAVAPFLNYVLATEMSRAQIGDAATGSSGSMKNISQEK